MHVVLYLNDYFLFLWKSGKRYVNIVQYWIGVIISDQIYWLFIDCGLGSCGLIYAEQDTINLERLKGGVVRIFQRGEVTLWQSEDTHQIVMLFFSACCRLFVWKRLIKGRVGVTLCQSKGTHQIVMLFSPSVVGCLLKKGLQKGGGSGAAHITPLQCSYTPD